jgi:drug/metabolite transporter superfamily protein YnfA
MTLIAWTIFLIAAILEVGGDAAIRVGLRGSQPSRIVLGFLILGCYGLIVNLVKWDFSKLLGVYVALFALVSVLIGKWFFKEMIPFSTWLGIGVIMAGGAIIQFGKR